ncbi:MAG: DUF4331 domain-containing protein [Acidimicrobiia bacterium]
MKRRFGPLVMLVVLSAMVISMVGGAGASSHREAPLISEDPVADGTDLYAWIVNPDVSAEQRRLAIVSNWIPLQEPASGPNFWKFGDDVLYAVHIDNDGDARQDITYYFKFQTTVKTGGTFLYNDNVVTVSTNDRGEAVDYPGLNVQQSYTFTEIRNGQKTASQSGLLTPPVNVGIRSTNTAASYATLAGAANYSVDGTGIRVFAGQRDEAFPVDLGSIFDLGGLRPLNGLHLLPLSTESGVNTTDGYNVHSLVIEVPVPRLLQGDEDVLGIWTTAERRKNRIFTGNSGAQLQHTGPWVQVSRLGMPLVNEVVIPLGLKDRFNASQPVDDGQFLSHVVDPELGKLIPFLYPGANITVPEAPRNDLVSIFLTGIPGLNQPADVVPSEMLRINTSMASGFPNGRPLLGDDVVDVALRAVAGIFCDGDITSPEDGCAGPSFSSTYNVAPNNVLSDGVSGNDMPFLTQFPYMPLPHSGYDS